MTTTPLYDPYLPDKEGARLSCDKIARIRAAEASHTAKQAERARSVWEDAATVPVRGTIAELYLRGRGISSHLPGTLRYQAQGFHPTACRFPSFATSRVQKARFSASCMFERTPEIGKGPKSPPTGSACRPHEPGTGRSPYRPCQRLPSAWVIADCSPRSG